MTSYQLIVKVMRVVDRKDPHKAGLSLKELITLGDVHIGFFDPADRPLRNIMGFTLTGEHLWTIAAPPVSRERFSRSWMRLKAGQDSRLIAISAEGLGYEIDHQTGTFSPVPTT